MTTRSLYDFDADSQVSAEENGVHKATITDRWHALGGGPNGGYLLGVCLRALGQKMAFSDPLVASAYFLRPGVVADADVTTELIRTGRRVGTGSATLSQEGKERLRVTATFGDLEQAGGRTLLVNKAPDLPAPEDCVDPLNGEGLPGVSITERVEYRFAEMPGWWQGKPIDVPSMEFWMRFKDGRDPDLVSLPTLVDAAPPAVLAVGEFASSTLELTVHLRAKPAPGWVACRASTRHLVGGYHEEDFEIWDSRGVLVAQARQFAMLP